MRIRSIKPEFWASEDIAALCWDDRLLFIGLWSYVDDNGVGRDIEKLIVADLFPLEDDPRDTLAKVSRGLARLADASLITRYTVAAKPYLHITTWDKHQRIDRPAKARYPAPTCDDAVIRDTLATPSRDTRDTLAPGTGEQGNRGTEEQDSSSGVADATPRPEVEELLDLLDEGIDLNGLRVPNRNKRNRDAMRLLIDRDGYTPEQVAWIIRWACSDEFWRTNILSASKLREKFPQLVAKSGAGTKPRVVGFGGEIDVDAILGRDLWSLPSPPEGITPGTRAFREWADEQRATRRAQRLEEARAVLARRGA